MNLYISNTRDRVSSGFPNKKYDAQRSMFDEIRGVWKPMKHCLECLIYLPIETKTKE